MTKLEFIDKINDILIGLNSAESDALGSLYDELMRSKWIPVEKELPPKFGRYMFLLASGDMVYEVYYPDLKLVENVTHWMEIQPPQRKEANHDS